MCKKHWFALPWAIRKRIWREYRPGQEDDKKPSHAYCMAAIDALTFIAEKEGREPDIRLYRMYDPGA